MNWRDKLTWIASTSNGVVRQRLYDRKILGIGLSLLDPGAKTWAAAIRKEAGYPFFYYDPHWDGFADDGEALKARQRIDALLVNVGALPGEMLMLDLELVSKDFTKRLLVGSTSGRGLMSGDEYAANPTPSQPGRPIAYTNMPYQDPTVVPYELLAEHGVHWYAQVYDGAMNPKDPGAVTLEILRWMESLMQPYAESLHVFYDGLRIASDQRDGAWFTAERIPGVFVPGSALIATTGTDSRWSDWTKDSLRAHYSEIAKKAA